MKSAWLPSSIKLAINALLSIQEELQGRRHSLFTAPSDECRLSPLLLAAVGDTYMRALQAVEPCSP